MALYSIELCAGVGMLGEGARAAFEFFGHEHRTICYVEREAAAAAQLVCLMEAGALDPAPVWSDLLTFDGAAWRGCVDLLIAGFPCQDISIAGRRAGLDGKRSGLFFNILDIADACGAWGLVLENVSAIATATATAVDEAEGALDERAAARVVGELADRGWDAEWITIPASDVGASHGRARWFCWAWRRVADSERAERRTECVGGNGCIKGNDRGRREAHRGAGVADAALGNSGLQHEHPMPAQQPGLGDGVVSDDTAVADAERTRWPQARCGPEIDAGREPQPGCSDLAHPPRNGWHQRRPEPGREQGRPDAAECGSAVADADGPGQRIGGICQREYDNPVSSHAAVAHPSQPRLPNTQQREPGGARRWIEGGATAELRAAPLFAPGPAETIWRHFIGASRVGAWERAVTDDEAGACPWAPATKPGVRMLADGMAIVVDESRAHQLRQAGNGVVSLQAAVALVELVRRAGIALHKT